MNKTAKRFSPFTYSIVSIALDCGKPTLDIINYPFLEEWITRNIS